MQILGQFLQGTYTGTGSAITLNPGINPLFMIIVDETSGTTWGMYLKGLAAGDYYKLTSAGPALVSSNGITATAASVTIGTDSGINTSGHTYRYLMF